MPKPRLRVAALAGLTALSVQPSGAQPTRYEGSGGMAGACRTLACGTRWAPTVTPP